MSDLVGNPEDRFSQNEAQLRIFKPLAILCGCRAWFVWDLVGNPEDRFSQNEAQIVSNTHLNYSSERQ